MESCRKNQFFFCSWKPRKADVILVWAKFTLYPKWRKVRSICTPPKFHQIYLHAYIHVFLPNICSKSHPTTQCHSLFCLIFASQLNASLSELIKLFKKLLWNSEISVSRYGWFPMEKSCMNRASFSKDLVTKNRTKYGDSYLHLCNSIDNWQSYHFIDEGNLSWSKPLMCVG